MLKYLVLFVFILNSCPSFAAINTNQSFSPYFSRNPSLQTRTRNNYNRNRNYRNPNPHARNGRYYSPYHPYHNCHNCLPSSNLSALEKYALKKNYARESDLARLERLEDLAFGSIQSGDIYSRYQNVENAILSRPQNNYKQSLLNNLSNYFAGQATGLSPNITSDNFTPFSSFGQTGGFYAPNYSNRTVEQYSNGIFGGGLGVMNQNFGSGTGLRILD